MFKFVSLQNDQQFGRRVPYYLGLIREKQGRVDDAIAWFDTFLSLNKADEVDEPDLLMRVRFQRAALIALHADNFDMHWPAIESLITQYGGKNLDIWLLAGRVLLDAGKLSQALALYPKALGTFCRS